VTNKQEEEKRIKANTITTINKTKKKKNRLTIVFNKRICSWIYTGYRKKKTVGLSRQNEREYTRMRKGERAIARIENQNEKVFFFCSKKKR